MNLSVILFLSLVTVCLGDQIVEEVLVHRKVQPLGGWFHGSPESPEVRAAAGHAADAFNARSKAKRWFKLVDVTTAQSQVTNGIHYRMAAVLRKTNCLKAEHGDLDKCQLEKKQLECHFEVTFSPRLRKHEVQVAKCKRQIPKLES
ncbi:cystatin [Stigmatopora nigra]